MTGDRNTLYQRFYALVDCIPPGRVATYGQIASEAGLPRHSRHVGYALRALPPGSKLPWYRVINSQGQISVRPGDSSTTQRRHLLAEGIELSDRGRISLKRFGWVPEF